MIERLQEEMITIQEKVRKLRLVMYSELDTFERVLQHFGTRVK